MGTPLVTALPERATASFMWSTALLAKPAGCEVEGGLASEERANDGQGRNHYWVPCARKIILPSSHLMFRHLEHWTRDLTISLILTLDKRAAEVTAATLC